MSYDLTLFQVPEGGDASAAFERLMEHEEFAAVDLEEWAKRPVSAAARAAMRRVAEALKSWRPDLEEFLPATPLPWIELNDNDLQVQFEVYEDRVDITLPYFRNRADEMIDSAIGALDLLCHVAQYSAFDPQLGRVVTAADRDEIIEAYHGADTVLPEILEQLPEGSERKPWWKVW